MTTKPSIFPPSGLNIPMPSRSVVAERGISGGSIVTGDGNFINTGDFRGALVAQDSPIHNAGQMAGTITHAAPADRQKLQSLLQQLADSLSGVPAEKTDDAEAVAASAEDLVKAAAQDKPNPSRLRALGTTLVTTAQQLATAAPAALSIAEKVVGLVAKIHQLGLVAMAWFAQHSQDWIFEKVMDYLVGHEATRSLSEDDLTKIAERVAELIKRQTGKHYVKQVYRELDSDDAITGVGATTDPGAKPAWIVPKPEFSERASESQEEQEETTTRTRINIEEVVLLSPVLAVSERRWRFVGREGEFGAPIRDVAFLARLFNAVGWAELSPCGNTDPAKLRCGW
jgi:hypothetical protein